MANPRLLQIFCGCLAVLLLAEPASLTAATRRRKHAPAKGDQDEERAKPTPAPSPAVSKRSARNKRSAPTPAPEEVEPAKTTASPHKPAPSPTPGDAAAKSELIKLSRESLPEEPLPQRSSAQGGAMNRSATGGGAGTAATSSVEPREVQDFDAQPEPVRRLLSAALDLTKRNLTYAYGSADPSGGGMDCSGTIYYLLKSQGFDNVPRQASEQYVWVRKDARFYAVLSKKADNFELDEMRPGDLLFWTGTYNVDRDPPVTHTMIYLGKRKSDGKRLMVGASDGRSYDGQRRNGVSVFDFKMPAARSADRTDAAAAAAPDHSPDFAGYGPVPGIADRNDAANRQASIKRQ